MLALTVPIDRRVFLIAQDRPLGYIELSGVDERRARIVFAFPSQIRVYREEVLERLTGSSVSAMEATLREILRSDPGRHQTIVSAAGREGINLRHRPRPFGPIPAAL